LNVNIFPTADDRSLNTSTIIKSITLEEAEDESLDTNNNSQQQEASITMTDYNPPPASQSQQQSQFKQFEPLKVMKFPSRDYSKEFTSSSSSSADTIVTVGMRGGS